MISILLINLTNGIFCTSHRLLFLIESTPTIFIFYTCSAWKVSVSIESLKRIVTSYLILTFATVSCICLFSCCLIVPLFLFMCYYNVFITALCQHFCLLSEFCSKVSVSVFSHYNDCIFQIVTKMWYSSVLICSIFPL